MNVNHKLTETDIINLDVKSQLKQQIQIRKTKESGWMFDNIDSMKIRFYKTGEISGSNYALNPLRSNAILIIQNVDKCCFLRSILAQLQP